LINKKHANIFNFKEALEDKRIGQISAWAKQNLSPNLVQLRTKCLQKAG
jgi:hypothetical protein